MHQNVLSERIVISRSEVWNNKRDMQHKSRYTPEMYVKS